METTGMKLCTMCGETKPYGGFSKCTANKDGLQYRCKECMSTVNASRYTAKKSGEYTGKLSEPSNSRHPYMRTTPDDKLEQMFKDFTNRHLLDELHRRGYSAPDMFYKRRFTF